MTLANCYIPYGAYWSTPFAKWQGSLSRLHAIRFAAWTARREFERRGWDATSFDSAVLGTTVPQRGVFYGVPWLGSLIGAPRLSGPTVAQACATAVRGLAVACAELAAGIAERVLVVAADRTSNGPVLHHPDPGSTEAAPPEDWVRANFAADPATGEGMLATAEAVASRYGFGREQQHELVLCRDEQYRAALAQDRAFLRRFMSLPFALPGPEFAEARQALDGDEGVYPTTAAGLERLQPVRAGGTVTYGSQTHPADGNAGIVVVGRAAARELSARPDVEVRILAFGQARAEPGLMPMAPVPAARRALARAGVDVAQLKAIKTHNPFAVNDLVLAREFGLDPFRFNHYGSSLIWGHPQAPTGLRSIIELIEELELSGGGVGLFTGCAAGDTAMAVVLRVAEAG